MKLVAWQQGLPLADPETANRLYLERLETELAASGSVNQAVLLGMDGVYDARGEMDDGLTDFMVPNDCVFQAVEGRPRLLPGASINPRRKDAVDELERCAAKGAVLVKVLPNSQIFDPSSPRFKPFYRAMAKLKIPLLSHVGYEFSLIGQDQSVGDPERLVPALEEGVTVIAAHGCSFGLFLYEKHFKTMLRLVDRYENFYVDTSALTLPNRVGALLKIRRHPELFERLIFGTDYPLPCFSYPCLANLSLGKWLKAHRANNRFDRHHDVLKALGVSCGKDFARLKACVEYRAFLPDAGHRDRPGFET